MTDTAALTTATAYYRAWSEGDFDAAMRFVAPDIVCRSPAGLVDGAEAFRNFMGPFAATVTSTALVAAYGDDHHAVLMYDTATPLVADAPGAEWHTVNNGLITEMRIIFDQLPFELPRRSQEV